jgi:hypothetical protein
MSTSPMANPKSGPDYSVYHDIFFFKFHIPQFEYHWFTQMEGNIKRKYGGKKQKTGKKGENEDLYPYKMKIMLEE